MTVNSLYPAFVKIFYTVSSRTHVQVLPVSGEPETWTPGQAADTINLNTRIGSVDFETFALAWANLIKPHFNTGGSITVAELWGYVSPDVDPIFYSAIALGVAGTSALATQAGSQVVMTNRTGGGGILRLYWMDVIYAPNQRDDLPFGNATMDAIYDYLLGNTCPITGRDNQYVVTSIRWVSKTNDKLRKKILLDS